MVCLISPDLDAIWKLFLQRLLLPSLSLTQLQSIMAAWLSNYICLYIITIAAGITRMSHNDYQTKRDASWNNWNCGPVLFSLTELGALRDKWRWQGRCSGTAPQMKQAICRHLSRGQKQDRMGWYSCVHTLISMLGPAGEKVGKALNTGGLHHNSSLTGLGEIWHSAGITYGTWWWCRLNRWACWPEGWQLEAAQRSELP